MVSRAPARDEDRVDDRVDGRVDDLSAYRWHTGAPLRRVEPYDELPTLFRDLGPVALARFLRGDLPRLAGPLTPLLYTRTARFREPYVDHERTGRVLFVDGRALGVWCSGVPDVYVARATREVPLERLAYVPGDEDFTRAAERAQGMTTASEWREAMGGPLHDERIAHDLATLDALHAELDETERLAAPLRRTLQSRSAAERAHARAAMAKLALDETDLCAAWHHLPRERRDAVREAMRQLACDALSGEARASIDEGPGAPTARSIVPSTRSAP